ncbi:MAG: heme o synthase [Thermodesulfovibrionales bacterium]
MTGVREYIRLTSPGINLLVMLTGFAGIWVAAQGAIAPLPALWCLLGIGLSSAGSSVFNNCFDRDIDRIMTRTRQRPLPSGRIGLSSALIFGIVLSSVALLIMIVFVNLLSAVLTASALFVYSFLYTVILKRRTRFATEIGGISGALPPVIGWAAVRGSLGPESLLLFAIMLLWQPPHFWALASKYREDYIRAGIPTMPVVKGRDTVNFRSLAYVLALVMVSIIPWWTGMSGLFYLSTALILGGLYIILAIAAILSEKSMDRQLFLFSIIYLTVVFTALVVDVRG